MNWDDLRIIAAVRDEGTYAGASARLRIDETTVGRRLARIQRDLGVPLFDAVDGLRRPTRHCEAVLEHVGAMAAHVAAIDRIGESQPGPVGRIRIASTNTVAEQLLAPHAPGFLHDNPGLTLQFLTASGNGQVLALAGRSRDSAAQAGEGRLHDLQARRSAAVFLRARRPRGRRADRLRLSG